MRKAIHRITHPNAVVPVMMGSAAAIIPIAKPAYPGDKAVMDDIMEAIANRDVTPLAGAAYHFVTSAEANFLEILGLGALAGISAYVGRKTGAHRATKVNSKWSVM